MCNQCGGMSKRQLVEKTRLNIVRHGWEAIIVEGDFTQPAIGYTVGLTELRHPEILVAGRDEQETYGLLSEMASMVVGHGHILEPGTELRLRQRRIHLAPLESPRGILLIGHSVYGTKLRALQAVWADDSDHLPWEQDVPDSLTQPVWGTPSEAARARGWESVNTG